MEKSMLKQKPLVSVVVAAYNEEQVIAGNIRKIITTMNERSDVEWELILVDDGSKDQTDRLIDEAAASDPRIKVHHHWRNFGQGRALRNGFNLCAGETIITLDADLSYGPEYIWKLFDELYKEKVEIVLASPYTKGGSVRNVPYHRFLLSRWGNRYLAKMSHYNISTSTCVVRAYRSEVLNNMYLTSDGMELQLEVLMKSVMMGYKVSEIPANLVWSEQKARGKGLRRVSKMDILQAIRLYLQMGWLSRPAYYFIIFGMLLILPGLYMASWQAWNIFNAVIRHVNTGEGILWGISKGIEEVYTAYVYSFVISGVLIIIGLQILILALLFIQNKFYFEELYRISQQILKKREMS